MTRILLLADIHANWAALQAIKEPHDVCIVLGDLVDYGLEPTPCIDWVRQHARYAVRGNHDHGAAHNVVVHGQSGFRYLTGVTRPLTRQLLQPADRVYLRDLPVTAAATIDNQRLFLVHATPRDPLDEYAPADAQYWAPQLEHVHADIICVGHTHMPFVLEVGNKLVINPGSVGLPRDGNPKASYAILEGRQVELKRIEYPVEETVKVIQGSALPAPAKELLIEVYRTGEAKNAKPGDSRMLKTRPSQQGVAIVKPKPTNQGTEARIVKPQATHQGVATPAADSTAPKRDTKAFPPPPGAKPAAPGNSKDDMLL